jgi:hypothetical protein
VTVQEPSRPSVPIRPAARAPITPPAAQAPTPVQLVPPTKPFDNLPPPKATSSFHRLVRGDKLVLREGDITPHQWKARVVARASRKPPGAYTHTLGCAQQELSDFLSSCPHVKSLRFQGVEITAEDANKLGDGLKQIRNITFCDNSIGLNEGSLEVLVALLLCCGMLESTSIIRNSLSDDHVPHIIDLLSRHMTLSHLSLSW